MGPTEHVCLGVHKITFKTINLIKDSAIKKIIITINFFYTTKTLI